MYNDLASFISSIPVPQAHIQGHFRRDAFYLWRDANNIIGTTTTASLHSSLM